MSEYCFKIKFNEPFISKNEKFEIFHAHYISEGDSFEIRIYFNPNEIHFDHIFSEWLRKINWSNIGKYFVVTDIKDSELIDLDFSEANVVGSKSGSNQYLNAEKYISIEVDRTRFVRKKETDKHNTAEFYLNENGFKLVSEYYSVLWQNTETAFSYARMRNMGDSHQMGKINFNPEFNFYSRDSRSIETSTIHKEPKFQLTFPSKTSEKEILKTVRLLVISSSFFYRKTIDFVTARIHFSNQSIVIRKKSLALIDKVDKLSIWPVFDVQNIDKFYEKIKLISIETDELKKLELIVTKFNQSSLVDVRSSILLRFAILEICKNIKKDEKPEQFKFIENGKTLSKKNKKILLNKARDLIITMVSDAERQEFMNKWTSSIDKILCKPMLSPFVTFLESIGFEPEKFDLQFSRIKEIRDSITHGSTEKFSEDELLACNQILYRISIGLILHKLKVENWIEDLNMSISK